MDFTIQSELRNIWLLLETILKVSALTIFPIAIGIGFVREMFRAFSGGVHGRVKR